MSIQLPNGLPARRVLRREGVKVCDTTDLQALTTRPLRIALVNLMPTREATEVQFARLLGNAAHAVELTLVLPDGHRPKSTPRHYIDAFYKRWSEIADEPWHGLIVTGAPVEELPFEAVSYWSELKGMIDWAGSQRIAALYICWGAQAALYHDHGVPKHSLPEKMFGVFPHDLARPGAGLLRGFGDGFAVPVSRHTEVRAEELSGIDGLEILAASPEAGVCLVQDRSKRATYMFNHLEYDADTLALEYWRDAQAGRAPAVPKNYFPHDDPGQRPTNGWTGHAHLFIRNWLDEIAERAEALRNIRQTVSWLLAEETPRAQPRAAGCAFLITTGGRDDRLPDMLATAAGLGFSPALVRHLGHGRHGCSHYLRFSGMGEAAGERLAQRLLRNFAVRRIAFRCSTGGGGLLVSGSDPGAPRIRAERAAA